MTGHTHEHTALGALVTGDVTQPDADADLHRLVAEWEANAEALDLIEAPGTEEDALADRQAALAEAILAFPARTAAGNGAKLAVWCEWCAGYFNDDQERQELAVLEAVAAQLQAL